MSTMPLSCLETDVAGPTITLSPSRDATRHSGPLPCLARPRSLAPFAPGWSLISPLPVLVEWTPGGDVIVTESVFSVYGVGDSPSEALRDCLASLVEYYNLVQRGAADNPYDREELRRLQAYLRPPSPRP